ncbi:HAD family hydrolase [Pseudaquabacterium pictum]|uniref:Hydrolase n=1 Tax=Pseudaquabacterium pictum TaxID=2315236 RepID=A0A480B169_9BURK|nr:HAD-IA family hydrolase [Rubrivivax pictus]GCL66342.1 hydrolase [Rubrivivax pictus]
MPLQALTLDLDDTLWPMAPTLRRAEALMQDWLRQHAPATVAAHDKAAWATLRRGVVADRPDWAHDLSALRRETIRRALLAAGDDPALATPAFDVFFEARQQVQLFDDVLPALARLAARWPIVALTNGNADVHRVPGLGQHFRGALSARELGLAKPAPAVFAAACRHAGAAPADTLHIGDDPALDIDGALAAGLQAAWVRRPELPDIGTPSGTAHHVVASLAELADRLGV